MIGGEFIDFRFGSWKSAVEGIGEWKHSMEYFPKPLKNTKLYQAELLIQREKRKVDKYTEMLWDFQIRESRQRRKAEQAAAESESAAE